MSTDYCNKEAQTFTFYRIIIYALNICITSYESAVLRYTLKLMQHILLLRKRNQ